MVNTFTKRNDIIDENRGFNLGTILRKRITRGKIGIEIECEGNKFQKESLPQPWTYHKDGSLRGKDNAEYVFGKPLEFEEVPDAIGALWKMFENYGTKLDESNRTSVHVHLNMQPFHLNRFTSLCALWFSVEEILTAWCGDHRVGNLFCLRAKDAPAIITKLRRFIRSNGTSELSEGLHYSGLNAQALHKFGSLEIRTMRGTSDPQVILDWVAILQRLYEFSAEFKDPRDVMALFSSEGPTYYLQTVLGDKAALVRNGINYTEDQVRDAMFDGIRLAQSLCYCRDWSLYKEEEPIVDPFGRVQKSKPAHTLDDIESLVLSGQMPTNNSGLTQFQTYWAANPPVSSDAFTLPMISEDEYEPDNEGEENDSHENDDEDDEDEYVPY